LGYPEAKTKAKEEQAKEEQAKQERAKARTGKSKGEIQGSLHCAMDGEAVHCFGRGDVWVVVVSGSAEVAAVLDGVLAAEDAGYGLGVGEVLLLEDAG
jgi:septal ring factor EnvC (AmiA/AmiB activator)